jgi:hypothetical protein
MVFVKKITAVHEANLALAVVELSAVDAMRARKTKHTTVNRIDYWATK